MARITGIVKELITPKADITVFLYDRETGGLIDSTISAVDGTFVFNDLDDTKRYTVTALSDNEAYNDGIDDNLEAVNDCDNSWSEVKLYLKFEGANNSTTFIDSSVYNNTITKTGTPIISTSSPAIGTSSGSFNGTSFLNLTDHTVTHLGSNNFTIEAWLKITSTLTTNYNVIICQRIAYSSGHNFTFLVNGPDLAGKLAFEFGSPTGGAPSIVLTDSVVFPLNTWTHVAVTRDGNTFRLFKNGVIVSTATHSGAGYASPSLPGIGRLPSGYNLNGGLGELRVTVGTARYTADFSSDLQTEYFPIEQC